jgi:5-methyltetrahydropteroyltriglutamate--homocysteine methyltransferase
MHETPSGSAHCLTPIEKPLLPVCGASLAPRSQHPGEGSAPAILRNRFATALSGVNLDNPKGHTGGTVVVPRIVGPIRRIRPVEVHDVEFLRANTDRKIKITLPGPFTMSRQAKNEFYKDEEELVMDYAAAVNAEIRDLKAAGADVIQLDEPWLQARAEEARRLALPAIDRALDGIPGPTALHLCFGYAYVARDKPNRYAFLPELAASKVEQISIEAAQPNLDLTTLAGLGDKTVIFGVISLGDPEPETPETVAARIRAAPRASAAGAADPGPRLRHEIHSPRHRLRQAQGNNRGCHDSLAAS